MLPFQMENRSPGDFPQSVYRLLIVQTEVIPLANGLNGFAHLSTILDQYIDPADISKIYIFIIQTRQTDCYARTEIVDRTAGTR
jgi:hypothetical protein